METRSSKKKKRDSKKENDNGVLNSTGDMPEAPSLEKSHDRYPKRRKINQSDIRELLSQEETHDVNVRQEEGKRNSKIITDVVEDFEKNILNSDEIKSLKIEKEKLRGEISALSSERTSLTKEVEKMKIEVSNVDKETSSILSRKKAIEDEVAALESRKKQLESSVALINNDLDKLRGETVQAVAELKKLKNESGFLEKKNKEERKNLSSITATVEGLRNSIRSRGQNPCVQTQMSITAKIPLRQIVHKNEKYSHNGELSNLISKLEQVYTTNVTNSLLDLLKDKSMLNENTIRAVVEVQTDDRQNTAGKMEPKKK